MFGFQGLEAFRLTDVANLSGFHVVEEDVAVGADGVGFPHLLAAGVGNGFGVGAPRQLFHAAEGHHGAFKRLVLQEVAFDGDVLSVKISEEGVGHGGDVGVPVFIHQIVDDHSRTEREVFFFLFDGVVHGHFHDEDDLLFIG